MYLLFLFFTFLQQPQVKRKQYVAVATTDGFCIVTQDSVFRWNAEEKWRASKLIHQDFSIIHKTAIQSDDRTLVFSSGIGLVYELKGDSLIRLDNSFDWQSRYFSENVYYNNRLYSFGGYGLMTYKNNLVYWDERTGEWVLEEYGKSESIPDKFIGYSNIRDSLMYLMNHGIADKRESKYQNLYQYNFNSKEWSVLGELKQVDQIKDFRYEFYLDNLFLSDIYGNINEYIFEENKVRTYSSQDRGVFSDSRNVIGNHALGQLLVFADIGNQSDLAYVFPVSEIIGNKFTVSEIYSPVVYRWPFVFFGFLILVGFVTYALLRKRDLIQLIRKKLAQIEGELNQDEKVILNLILNHYPSPIELPEVLANFAPELTFESRVKKFRKSIKHIESVVQQKTNFKNAVFIHSKNKEDKRIKEIGITKEK